MYIFNSDHDLALANFTTNYTPPASAVKMRSDLALLPVWYADGDNVISDSEADRLYLQKLKDILPLTSHLIYTEDIHNYPDEKVIPWGWNPSIRKKLSLFGVNELYLPSLNKLEQVREYSHRKNGVKLLRELRSELSGTCGESHYFIELENLLLYLKSIPGDKVLKMPLSGSGKGLIWILGDITDKQTDWCRRVIRQQDGVVAEPVLAKERDFAMEFYLNNGSVRFAGYSLFAAAKSGAYSGNDLLSDENIEKELSKYISVSQLHKLRELLMLKLPKYYPQYSGYAGVDMMICREKESEGIKYILQPCVEVNMRMNMGVVSRLFHDRFMYPQSKGQFVVEYFKKPGNILDFHEKMQRESPIEVHNEKIISGYLPLTPVAADTRYIAYVLVF